MLLLLEKGADINVQGGRHGGALQAAAFRGHEATVQLLLNKGACVNAQGGRYGNPLQAACFSASQTVRQLLLDSGADVKAQSAVIQQLLLTYSIITRE